MNRWTNSQFINIKDSVNTDLAIKNPPKKNDKVKIFNQITETHNSVRFS